MKRYIHANLVQYNNPEELEVIGEIVDNDGDMDSLAAVLRPYFKIEDITHVGNFMFKAPTKDGRLLTIYTYPMDRNADRIRIDAITIRDGR